MEESELEKLTVQEAADFLEVKRSTIFHYVKKGKLSPCHIGMHGKYYFSKFRVAELKIKQQLANQRGNKHFTHHPKLSYDEMEIIKEWRVQPDDVASLDVQIGLLTNKIEEIEEELKFFQDKDADFKNLRIHLLKATNQRRKNLNLLRSTDTLRYKKALKKTGLRA